MKNIKNTWGGFTIIEMLMVTAISGMIAISAFSIINGQQQKNEMRQGVIGFENKITDIANDVSTGYFPNESSYPRCGVSGGAISFTGFGTVGDGASAACIFGGKIIRFNNAGPGPEDMFDVYTVAARRVDSDGNPYTDLYDLNTGQIRIAMKSSTELVNEPTNIGYNLRIKSAVVRGPGGSTSNIGGLVFLSGFGKYNQGGSSSTLTGTPTTDIYYFDSTIVDINTTASNPSNYEELNADESIVVCVQQGASGSTAEVIFGQKGRNLSIQSDMAKAC
jgi:prepilin-type N-terminal cleavage/methylation domain-containing protein